MICGLYILYNKTLYFNSKYSSPRNFQLLLQHFCVLNHTFDMDTCRKQFPLCMTGNYFQIFVQIENNSKRMESQWAMKLAKISVNISLFS